MKNHTWYDLADHFCAREKSLLDGGDNEYFERLAARRYNYATKNIPGSLRLVFLKEGAKNKTNKTLSRDGRFIWVKNLKYEGRDKEGYRNVSFTINKGNKRFVVSERHILAIPHNIYINNNSFFKKYNRIFASFSSVFNCREAAKLMKRNDDNHWNDLDDFMEFLRSESPFQPGALVRPRKGLFFPRLNKLQEKMSDLSLEFCQSEGLTKFSGRLNQYLAGRSYSHTTADPELLDVFHRFNKWSDEKPEAAHPVGVILGPTRNVSPYSGRELYRVTFAETIYEDIHPIQLEVINEV